MTSRRIRLCLKDLYHQDVVEMIERETRQWQVWEILTPEDSSFSEAYRLLWEAFGAAGEMEREDVIRDFIWANPFRPNADGTYLRYFLLVARDETGRVCGVRDGAVVVNPAYCDDLCLVYLSHIYIRPEARGRVGSYWMRVAPVEIAHAFLADLHARGLVALRAPNRPGRMFGMRIVLAAEMEYFSPEDKLSAQRLLFYGRGGFDAINPRHFPYRQPDFREPELIASTGNLPRPFMLLVRRVGRERQARMPIDEAMAVMNLLYDVFEAHCAPAYLVNSLDLVLDRLESRRRTQNFVELLPLPTGARDVHRFKALFRHKVYRLYYPHDSATQAYLKGPIGEQLKADRRWLDRELARMAAELDRRPAWVYANRERDFTWEGEPVPSGDLGG